jgi:hypothetical protein
MISSSRSLHWINRCVQASELADAGGAVKALDVRNATWMLIAALAGLSSGTALARADCVSACQAATYCDSEMHASGECGRLLNDCYIDQCSRKTYGSIAYGARSGAVGWSYDFADAPSAENEALKNCSAKGDDCQVVVDFWNTCAAVATDQDLVAYGLGDTRGQAEDGAIAACAEDGGGDCAIQAWSCSLP